MTGLALLFSPYIVEDEQQTLAIISPLIQAVSVFPHRCLSSTWLTAEFCSKRVIKAAIVMKPSFLLDSLLLPAVPHVAGRALPLWNRSCWKWILLKQTSFCSVLTQASSPNSWAICTEKALCVCGKVWGGLILFGFGFLCFGVFCFFLLVWFLGCFCCCCCCCSFLEASSQSQSVVQRTIYWKTVFWAEDLHYQPCASIFFEIYKKLGFRFRCRWNYS